MHGLHLTADLQGCTGQTAAMTDVDALRTLCLREVKTAGLQAMGELFHRFGPSEEQPLGGVTGMVLLAESHLAVHTWPERGFVTLDVFVCNVGTDNSARARQLLDRIEAAFGAKQALRHELRRADMPALFSPPHP